jgi:putative copper export protein
MSTHVLIDFLHLAATVVWIGGMVFIPAVFIPAISSLDGPTGGRVFSALGKRFTIVAWTCTVTLLVTGLLKTPTELLFNLDTRYGTYLTIKHGLFLLMIVVGLLITLAFVPRMIKLSPKPGETPSADFIKFQKRIELLSKINLLLGVLVLLSLVIMRQ